MNTKKTQNSTDKAPELPQVVSAAPSSANGERLGIAAVERDTGLGKDTLRVWERRYGFPLPERDAQGERAYPMAQVQRLRQLRRLLDLGHRPGRVVPLDEAALAALLAQAAVPPTRTGVATDDAALDQAVSLLRSHDADALRRHLSQAQLKNGLATFVTQVLAPLTTRVGEAWMAGTLRVFEEHLYTEVVQSLLRQVTTEPLPGLKTGGIGVKAVRDLAKRMGSTTEHLGPVVHLALGLGLVGQLSEFVGKGRTASWVHRYEVNPERAAEWRRTSIADQWIQLVDAWIDALEQDDDVQKVFHTLA